MKPADYHRLLAIARRHTRRTAEAQDLLNDALVAAMERGRLLTGTDDAWIAGTIRNLAAMQARGAVRRRKRDESVARTESVIVSPQDPADPLLVRIAGLPRGARIVALLALRGMDRSEIASALNLSDEALRQRLMTLRRHLEGFDPDPAGVGPSMSLGSMRASLLRVLRRTPGIGTRDPDGHLLVFFRTRTSRPSPPRQQQGKET